MTYKPSGLQEEIYDVHAVSDHLRRKEPGKATHLRHRGMGEKRSVTVRAKEGIIKPCPINTDDIVLQEDLLALTLDDELSG